MTLAPFEPPALQLGLDEACNGYQAGWQEVPVEHRPRYVASLDAIVQVIRGEQQPDRTPQHELDVQETLLRISGLEPG